MAEDLRAFRCVGRGCRRQVTFLVSPRKVTKRRRPCCATPSGRAST